jgi:hypothetical protein
MKRTNGCFWEQVSWIVLPAAVLATASSAAAAENSSAKLQGTSVACLVAFG